MIATYFKPTVNCTSWSDRFNSTWTFLFFLILAAISGLRHYFGPNATCWTPPEFTSQMTKYVESACWTAREINSVDDKPMVTAYSQYADNSDSESSRTLYQLLPLILVFQALFFRLPDVILRILDSTVGFNSSQFVTMVEGYNTMTSSDRITLAQNVSNYLNYVFNSRIFKFIPFGIVTCLLVFIKLLFFVNAVTQLSLLGSYLSPGNSSSFVDYSYNSIISSNYSNFATSPVFPRSVQCDFVIRLLTRFQHFSVGCYLPVNEFNEQVCFLVWIWLLVVCLAAAASSVVLMTKSVIPIFRKRFVTKYLQMGKITPYSPHIDVFTNQIIGQDGVLIMEMIGEVSSDILVRDILFNLWYMHESHNSDVMAQSVSQTSHQDSCDNKIQSADGAPEAIEMEKQLIKQI